MRSAAAPHEERRALGQPLGKSVMVLVGMREDHPEEGWVGTGESSDRGERNQGSVRQIEGLAHVEHQAFPWATSSTHVPPISRLPR